MGSKTQFASNNKMQHYICKLYLDLKVQTGNLVNLLRFIHNV